MLPYVVGIVLSIGVAVFARLVRLDRDRAFYPTVTIVIASYYVLFAAMTGSVQTVVLESAVMTLFVIAAVAGFKGSAWIIVGALAGHGVQDAYKRALTAHGSYTTTGGSNRQLMDALLFGPVLSIGRQKFGNVLMKPNQGDLLVLKELCETGRVRPVIDRRFPLSEVSFAVRYVEDGPARGKVVVTV
jgi:D-arabinose 1-dehydrogenase-like Zn-dependent alcohol dehydrogenase